MVMIDKENVIGNLEMNIRWISDHPAHQFPGWGNAVSAMTDALELLKEQEAIVRCKDCKHGEPCNDGEIYCEKDIGTFETAVHKPDWYCADGERKGGR